MMRGKGVAALAAISVVLLSGMAGAETIEQRLERMEAEIRELRDELRRRDEADGKRKQTPVPAAAAEPVPAPPTETAAPATPGVETAAKKGSAGATASEVVRAITDRVRIGAYASTRFETSSLDNLNNSFVFRRFVLTADANVAPRMRAYAELEFERFRELELEKSSGPEDGGLTVEQTVEGTNESEIAMEQAWLQWDFSKWASFRGGEVLVPLGRFNINHDDNLWNIPRRSLIDRGVPVLPVQAAWGEVGAGFLGDIEIGRDATLNYQTYVVNGVSLDTEFEQIARTRDPEAPEIVTEVEVTPSNGPFGSDVKDAKAWTGRLAYSPLLAQELGVSWYYGRYTPDYLSNQSVYSLGVDGLATWGPFQLEGEFLFTKWGGIKSVAESLAQVAVDQVSETENPDLNTEVEFELAGLARQKSGFWLEGRYYWWPQGLNDTFLGKYFDNPQFVAVLRGENAWLTGLVDEIDFAGGVLRSFETQDRFVARITPALAYRPTPLVVFSVAYEYTWTNSGQSLSSVTNFLPAGPSEDDNSAVLVGLAFGF